MEIRNSCRARRRGGGWTDFGFGDFRSLIFLALLTAGCGAPGEPVPPSPPIPLAVTDLTARQIGDTVVLTFTLPSKSTLGDRLAEVPTLEVLRGALLPDRTPNPKSFRLVDTVPGSVLSNYVLQGKVEFPEPILPEQIRALPGETVLYRVRTRVSERKVSADSNEISVGLYPVPDRIDALDCKVTEKSIRLSWGVPNRTSAGAQLPPIQEYHVYRGELDPATASAAEKDLRVAKWKLPLLKIATTTVPEYQDAGFDFGKTYAYIVRSAISEGGALLESGDSRAAILTPKDIFPPAAPQDVVAAVLSGASSGAFVVDLSWTINLENDLAGYRIYRSEQKDVRGQLLTPELTPTPAYRDTAVAAGKQYWYTVTAVDRAGNESAPSAVVLVEIP
jgi:hypothetical protein